jgi:hypothetical protein
VTAGASIGVTRHLAPRRVGHDEGDVVSRAKVSGRHAAIDGEVLAGNPDIADLFEVIGMDGVTNATAG